MDRGDGLRGWVEEVYKNLYKKKECNKRLTQKLVKPVAKHKHKKGGKSSQNKKKSLQEQNYYKDE